MTCRPLRVGARPKSPHLDLGPAEWGGDSSGPHRLILLTHQQKEILLGSDLNRQGSRFSCRILQIFHHKTKGPKTFEKLKHCSQGLVT